MLPTMGLYKNMDCPYYENSCDRPYCHFRHRKKNLDAETASSSVITEIPTYNPTPKSQLANARSHIPISYVPDLALRRENSTFRSYSLNDKLPTYKPTPLSILSTGKTNNTEVSDEDVQEEVPLDLEDLQNEFDMIDELINDNVSETVTPKPETVTEILKCKPKIDKKPKEKTKSSSKSKSKSSSTHNSKNDKKDKSKRNEKKSKDDKQRSSSSGSKSKTISRDRHSSRHKERRNHKSKSKESSKTTKDKKKENDKSSKIEDNDEDHDNGNIDFNDLEDSDFDEDPMMECYKIFNEYKPMEPEICPEVIKAVEEQPVHVLKKRIAHDNVDKHKPKSFNSVKSAAPSAAQIMVNRYKAIRQMQVGKDEKNVDYIAEINRHLLKRPADNPIEKKAPVKLPKAEKVLTAVPSTSLVDDIISARTSKPRRIAPVQNVNSIQRAKAKIEEMAKIKAANTLTKTSTQTTAKGEKRVAHIPEASASDVPELLGAERSKLPVNVRSRYLSMIFDECRKLYLSTEEAQQRAASEEYKCYERCAALVTYRNSAMLAINRLRKELQEREISGLGPILPGDSSSAVKDGTSEINGLSFYNNIKQFILDDDELLLHGFPREGSKPGRGLIPNQKQASRVDLDEFDRICCRCSKLYRVDEEGFALYEEECLYHPLKKRTFRGESFYLCCKSGEGSGCVTAASHVSETRNDENEIEGYQTTMPSDDDTDPRNSEVFALDCEMCYTTKGLELTRVTIVNSDCKTVYETLVKPFNAIIDYNTRFSGITKEQMNRTATSILQVQANILHLCNANTILIGHSLESDMKALKIIHNSVIDTSLLFPHKFGLPHKRALRDLAREYLKKIIQNDVSGHDSAEDALTCMELVQWKVKESFKSRGIKV